MTPTNRARTCRARVSRLSLILVALLAASPCVEPRGGARLDASSSLTPDQWQQDLQYMATELPLLHKNAFTKITPDQFNQAVADLSRDIPLLQDHEIVVRMTRIVAMIGDAHTNLITAGSVVRFKSFPLRLYWFADGLYVTGAEAGYGGAVGARVVRIGATDVGQAYGAVAELIPHENDQWLRAQSPAMLVTPEVLQALGILPDTYAGHFVFQNAAGEEFSLDVTPASSKGNINWGAGVGAGKTKRTHAKEGGGWTSAPDPARAPLPSYLKHPDLNYWFEYLPDSRTLYIQYNVCQDAPGLPFSQFTQTVKDYAAAHQIDRAVIDLRNNTGGSSGVFSPMLNWVQTDAYFSQRGRTFVITGRRTFSSGMINAWQLMYLTNAISVGEPTGGKPNSFGEVRSFRLPNSGLTVFYSTKFFTLLPDDPPYLSPQVPVEITSADYLAGRDPALDALFGVF